MYKEAIEIAVALCKTFEGFRSKPYICPAGYATQGYGTVYKPDGTRVTMEDPKISIETADKWLRHTLLKTYLPGILKASPNIAKYPKALAALVDFAYNLGVPNYRASTLRKRINAEDWDGARVEIKRWNKGGGKILPGLVKRRKIESDLLPISKSVY